MHVKHVQKTARTGTKSDMELRRRPIVGAFKKLDRIGSHDRIYVPKHITDSFRKYYNILKIRTELNTLFTYNRGSFRFDNSDCKTLNRV